MAKYRKKPVVIEAMQFTEDSVDAIDAWMSTSQPQPAFGFQGNLTLPVTRHVVIMTLEGEMKADLGDWIIRGVKGEFYPCKPDIFEATYDPCELTPAFLARLESGDDGDQDPPNDDDG